MLHSFLILLVSLMAVQAVPVAQNKAQASKGAKSQAAAIHPAEGPSTAPVKDANVVIGKARIIKAKYRASAKRAIIRYPAFTLAARGKGSGMSMDPNGQAGILKAGQGMCSKCTLLSAHFRFVYANGEEATPKDGVYIHHMTSHLSPKKANNPIGSGSINTGNGAYFIDRGEDSGQTDTVFTSQDGKFNSGYHVNGQPSISVQYDVVNYKDVAKQVHLEIEYEYVDGIVGQDAGHTLKSVAGSPKLTGKSSSAPMKISRDTTIMWARGHLHQGGVSMTMKVNGAVKCVSKPTYNAAGVITTMALCPEAVKLKAGDSLVIESLYDTKAHPLREASDGSGHSAHGKFGGSDVMGMIAMSYTM